MGIFRSQINLPLTLYYSYFFQVANDQIRGRARKRIVTAEAERGLIQGKKANHLLPKVGKFQKQFFMHSNLPKNELDFLLNSAQRV